MAFFWFIVALVLFSVLMSRKKGKESDDYAQGYWDGYRALADDVATLIDEERATPAALRKLVRRGEGSVAETVSSLQPEVVMPVASTNQPLFDDAPDAFMETDRTAATSIQLFDERPVAVTTEPTEAERAARSLRNLNTILYMASFLLVAAGALFVAAAMPDAVKLIGVWLIIAAFYGVGVTLYQLVVRLRPAALAFIGTGLALVPFGGVALGQYTQLGAEVSWLLTSVIGIGAYLFVALRLQSQLVSYLTLAFVLSMAASSAALVDGGLVGQFVALIVIALLANIVAVLRPSWVPAVFRQPIEHTGQVVTPLVLVASLVGAPSMTLADYEIVSVVATLHYLVAWLQQRTLYLETIVRVLLSIVVMLFVVDVADADYAISLLVAFAIVTFQQAYSVLQATRPGRAATEYAWLGVTFGVQILLTLLWQTTADAALYTTVSLVVLGLMSFSATLRLRQVRIALVGLVASLVLPFVALRQLPEVALPWWSLAVVFGAAAAATLWAYWRLRARSQDVRQLLGGAFGLYLGGLLFTAGLSGESLTLLWAYAAAGGLLLVASHVARRPWLLAVVAPLLLVAIWFGSWYWQIDGQWRALFVGGITAAGLWLLTAGYLRTRLVRRAVYTFVSAQLGFVLVAFGLIGADDAVKRWTLAALVVVIVATLAVRLTVGVRLRAVAQTALLSIVGYFIMAVLAGVMISDAWALGVIVFGIGLFTYLSYIEVAPVLQLVASSLVVAALWFAATLLLVPSGWIALFVWGGAALIHYAATALHAAYQQADRQYMMALLGQVLLLLIATGGIGAPLLVAQLTVSILLIAAAASLALRWWNRDRSLRYGSLFQVSYVTYYVVGLLLALMLPAGWGIIAFALGALVFWAGSYAERLPGLMFLGNAFAALTTIRLWPWAGFDSEWFVLGVGWIIAALCYFGYGVFTGLRDGERRQYMLWSTWLAMGLAGGITFLFQGFTVSVAVLVLALAATLGIEAYQRRSWALGEAAIYVANVAFQRLMGVLYPELNAVFYAHWWALLVAVVALVRRSDVRPRLVVAMALVSISSGLYALGEGGFYQLLFLAEHLALLVIGALRQKTWAIWWGITASAVAILYFLRDYTFLWLGFLGLLLIAIVVWRLMRSSTND